LKNENIQTKQRLIKKAHTSVLFFEYGQRAVTAGKKKIYYLW